MTSKIYIIGIAMFQTLCTYGQNAASNQLLKPNAHNTPPANSVKALPKLATDDWLAAATKKIDAMDYSFIKNENPNEYRSYNKNSGLSFLINPHGYVVNNNPVTDKMAAWQTGFQLKAVTRGKTAWKSDEFIASSVAESDAKFTYTHFDIDYLNDKQGMRQNFIIKQKQDGTGDLKVVLALGDQFNYQLKDNNKLYCYADGTSKKKPALIYDDLKVWDASGRMLPAAMQVTGNSLSIVVNDNDARYPITVDPLNHTSEWASSASGILTSILTTTQLQVDALYGFNVAGVGDVNGDGYDDVAIGAPGTVNLIGASTIVGAGAVFVYFGSPAGLSSTPDKVLRSTTPIANALFGFSVAGGNVIGNNRNDIVVGAPGESYTASVGFVGGTTTATVTAGKVYVFRGEDLTTAAPTPFLSVFIDGSAYLNQGIAGIIGSNVTVNALFGFSVSTTEDMNGDGLGEVIVGAPGYASLTLGLVPVTSGAAFVYYSGNLATNTPVSLTPPAATLLGIPLINLNGLLFGFSVDGLGDYDKDGKPDVIVGAPAGVLLGGGNLLGGSAYVYNGNGAGVNTAFGTEFTAPGALIGNIANLFGFSVKGVTDINGKRNGNALVGAPNGNLLSNILNGLKLKSGTVNVFVSKSGPGVLQTPVQALPSPRNTSLLTLLSGLNLNVTALFGASIDNMLDVNCDGINDIIVGEPLSTAVGLVGVNAIGGAATIFTGKADGTYNTAAYWDLENSVSYDAGVNAGSLLGYSVAGARHTRGALLGVRSLVGAPGGALDFSSGILNLGNTMSTLFSFVGGSNGLGKSYMSGYTNCGVIYNPDINVTFINQPVFGSANTNDVVPVGTTYGTPVGFAGNKLTATLTMFSDGTYTFTSTAVGVFSYNVPVCLPDGSPCQPVELDITVLNSAITTNPPVASTDIATTHAGVAVTIKSLANDRCYNSGCTLNFSTVSVSANPLHGTATVNTTNGDITYTPTAGFTGSDTLTYSVCDNGSPAQCATAKQVITVYAATVANTTTAADDFSTMYVGNPVSGSIKTNDVDAESNVQTIAPQTTSLPGVGSLIVSANGNFTFTPLPAYTGPAGFSYTTCDNGVPSVCAGATLYLLIKPLTGTLSTTFISLNYTKKDCGIDLHFTMAQDISAKSFIVQNSVNGIDWVNVGTVVPTGSADVKTTYEFLHANPAQGQNFYRIAIASKQGTIAYSTTLTAMVTCADATIRVQPNPFRDNISVYFTATTQELVTITILNGNGKQLLSTDAFVKSGINEIKLTNLALLPSAMYILQVKTAAGIYNEKIMK